MYLYIEMWNVTQEWMDYPLEKRKKLMEDMQQRVADFKNSGAENLGWGTNDEHTLYRSDYMYFTVWKMPSKKDAEIYEQNLKEVGWFKYFSQANSRGKLISQEEAVDYMVNLKKTSTSLND